MSTLSKRGPAGVRAGITAPGRRRCRWIVPRFTSSGPPRPKASPCSSASCFDDPNGGFFADGTVAAVGFGAALRLTARRRRGDGAGSALHRSWRGWGVMWRGRSEACRTARFRRLKEPAKTLQICAAFPVLFLQGLASETCHAAPPGAGATSPKSGNGFCSAPTSAFVAGRSRFLTHNAANRHKILTLPKFTGSANPQTALAVFLKCRQNDSIRFAASGLLTTRSPDGGISALMVRSDNGV